MLDIRHKVGIKSSQEKVFNTISTTQGVAKWWTRDTTGENHKGGEIRFSFSKRLDKSFDVLVEITELAPPNKVCWKILEGPEE